jgi:lysophospholipase L1-like esterase
MARLISRIMRRVIGMLAVFSAAVLYSPALGAQPSADSPALAADRWKEALAAFAAADRKQAPPPGGVLFVGSSSIRLWDGLESQFADAPVVLKRGFGGSRLSDCVRHLDRLVINYRPRLVVLYAGDNDLAEGATPEEVLERVKTFSRGVHEQLPDTRVAFVSIKPSPARIALIGKARAANKLVKEYAAAHPQVEYIDVFTPMLGQNGLPRPELFAGDRLHLSSVGYALWRSIIRPFVR